PESPAETAVGIGGERSRLLVPEVDQPQPDSPAGLVERLRPVSGQRHHVLDSALDERLDKEISAVHRILHGRRADTSTDILAASSGVSADLTFRRWRRKRIKELVDCQTASTSPGDEERERHLNES